MSFFDNLEGEVTKGVGEGDIHHTICLFWRRGGNGLSNYYNAGF